MAEAFLTGQSGKKLVGNAVVGDVLSGKTFSNASSNKLTGTMPNRGKVDYQMPINGSFTIPAGYHNGTGSIFQSVTTKGSETFTPGTVNQTVASGRYLTGTQTILGDANLVAGNIKNGVSIFGVIGSAAIPGGTAGAAQILAGYTFINSQGVEVAGTIPSKGAETFTPGTTNQTIALGQYLGGTQTIIGDADLVTGNIKSGANIFGVAGKTSVVDTSSANATAARILSGYTGYVNGAKITGTIPSKAAATYTPGKTNQTIAAGQYLGGTQTITGDADLVTGNIKSGANIFGIAGKASVVDTADASMPNSGYLYPGVTAYVNGAKITGTMPNRGSTYIALTTQGAAHTIAYGYHDGGTVTASFSNLSAGNVKKGVNVGGVVGTLVDANINDATIKSGMNGHMKHDGYSGEAGWSGYIGGKSNVTIDNSTSTTTVVTSALISVLMWNSGTTTGSTHSTVTINSSVPFFLNGAENTSYTWPTRFSGSSTWAIINPNRATITIKNTKSSATHSYIYMREIII